MINQNKIKSSDKLIRAALSLLFFPLTIIQKIITKREVTKYQMKGSRGLFLEPEWEEFH